MYKSYVLLKVLLEYAPNSYAQRRIVENYHLMINDKLSQTDIEKELAGTIYNGLAYGNWPWMPYVVPSKEDNAKVRIR